MTAPRSSYTDEAALACDICAGLRDGRIRHPETWSPHCKVCGLHHWLDYPHSMVGLPKSRCPCCRVNKRALEDIPESARWERKRYAPFCESCLLAEGYVKVEHTVDLLYKGQLVDQVVSWWVKPAPPVDEAEGAKWMEALWERDRRAR